MKTTCLIEKFDVGVILTAGSLLIGSAVSGAEPAQQVVPLPIEDALKVRSFAPFAPARFSPDGTKFVYVVKDPERQRSTTLGSNMTDVPSWGIGGDIVVLDVATGASRNITEGLADNWLPAWSPDGRYLAFLSDRGSVDSARLWVWDSGRNVLRKVSEARIRSQNIAWTPDSKTIIVTTPPEASAAEADIEEKPSSFSQALNRSKQPESTVILYTSNTGSTSDQEKPASDPWDLNMYLRDLVIINVSDGSFQPLIRGQRIGQYRMSPDGSQIAYTIHMHFEKAGSQQILFDLATISIARREKHVLASGIRLDVSGAAFNWSPDSSWIAFRTGGMEEKVLDCFVVGLHDGGLRNVSTLPMLETRPKDMTGPPLWDSRGVNIYFVRDGALWRATLEGHAAVKIADIPGRLIARLIHHSQNVLSTSVDDCAIVITKDNLGKQDGFYSVDLRHGTSLKLLEKQQCYTCLSLDEWQHADLSSDGHNLTFYAEDAGHSPDLWITEPSFRTIRRLSHLNPQFDKVAMGAARLIEWRSEDGQPLKGALLLPSNYEEGKRYPLIVWVYGGALLSSQLDHFGLGYGGPFNMQIFATRGYAVLMPDAPQHKSTPMADLAKAVLPGVEKVIEMGIADPERLGIMGHSYGSYCTLALIVQTQRFKAALASDGTSDLIAAYGQMDAHGAAYGTSIMEGGQGLMGGPPWEFPQRYVQNSPLFYLDRVETPLFIAHGTQDTAVAPFLGDETFVGLRRLGKTVLYAKYEGEDHIPGNWSYGNQLDFSKRMLEWFNDYVKEPAAFQSKTTEKTQPLSQK